MSYRVRVMICLSTVLALGIFIGKYLQDSALLFPEAHAAGSPVPGPNTLAHWAVPGTSRQPPPERGRPDPMSEFIKNGEWGPAFNAQNEMLDEHAEKYNLQDEDWRRSRPWYEPTR